MKLEVEDHEMGRACLSHLVALDLSFLLNLICLMYKIEINIYTEVGREGQCNGGCEGLL